MGKGQRSRTDMDRIDRSAEPFEASNSQKASTMSDPYNLERFVTAQEPVFDTILEELKAGQKRTHWMWFVFPSYGMRVPADREHGLNETASR